VRVAMEGNSDNVRSRAVYDATEDWGCDAVAAATFKIELLPDSTAFEVEMKGFSVNLTLKVGTC